MAYIEFDNVVKSYGSGDAEVRALDGASFSVERGELAVVLGASGAGKTTALNILGGMDTATSGRVTVDGRDVTAESESELVEYRRADVGFVFQFYNLVPNLTALENVELAAQICPDSLDARSYLAAIALELDARGFDEVLFDNFTVPDDSSIAWDTEAITQIAALEDCAETLGANLTGSSIRLALGTTVPSVAQYASRVYITTEKANDVMTVTEDMAEVLPDPSTQLVFITTSHDTRFDASGVIRPLLGGDGGD